jgi:thiol-disulfide isomerase/thioredoxin
MKRLLILLFFTLFISISAHANVKSVSPSQLEEALKNSEYPSMIMFFTSWCSLCRLKFGGFVNFQKKFPKVKFQAVSLDYDSESLVNFLKPHEMDKLVYHLDYEYAEQVSELSRRLGINYNNRVPHVAIIGSRGNIVYDGSFNLTEVNIKLEEVSR